MTEKKFEIAGTVSIVSTGKKTVAKEAFEKVLEDQLQAPTSIGSSLEDLFDRFSKLIYVIDASGSMGDGMKPDAEQVDYIWTEDAVQEGRELLIEMIEEGDTILDPEAGVDLTVAKVKKLSDEDVKKVILEEGLESGIGVETKLKVGGSFKGRTKMMAVKDAAKEFVRARFKKYPDARVIVYKFEQAPAMLSPGATEQGTLDAIDRLPDFGGGGTDIFKAVERAVFECKKRPSEVKVHHIVLVSDGLDSGARGVQNLVSVMKEIGIVFDFIFIQGRNDDAELDGVINVLRGVCEATGGEFTIVKTEKDFVQKFLAVSNRKCLPPAPKQLK